jgi:hypothetical protein
MYLSRNTRSVRLAAETDRRILCSSLTKFLYVHAYEMTMEGNGVGSVDRRIRFINNFVAIYRIRRFR